MDDEMKPPNVLYLSGVTLEDFKSTEDLMEQKILNDADTYVEPVTEKYQEIPKVFYTINSWVKKTNLRCWMCDFIFEEQFSFGSWVDAFLQTFLFIAI